MKKRLGQITTGALVGIASVVGSVAGPVIYYENKFSAVKEENAGIKQNVSVLQESQTNTQEEVVTLKTDLKEDIGDVAKDVDELRNLSKEQNEKMVDLTRKVDRLLIEEGINPINLK